jgi:hypothetical protein
MVVSAAVFGKFISGADDKPYTINRYTSRKKREKGNYG